MVGGDFSPAETPVLLIPVDQIDPGDRLRQLKDEQAHAIGAAIKADGQYDPITVARLPGSTRFILVDGLHRLEGCKAHGITHIEARIGTANREARVRQEVLSGVARATHDVFDKAAQIGALAALAREAAGKPASGDLRKLNGGPLKNAMDDAAADLVTITNSMHWSESAADQMGCSASTVRKYTLIAARFSPENVDLLRRKGLAHELVPLTRLAALNPDKFDRAMAFINAKDKPEIAEALEFVADAAKPTPFNKKFEKFIGWVDGLDVRERKQIMADLTARYDGDGKPLKQPKTDGAA